LPVGRADHEGARAGAAGQAGGLGVEVQQAIVVHGIHAGEAGVDDPRRHEPVGEGLGVAQAG